MAAIGSGIVVCLCGCLLQLRCGVALHEAAVSIGSFGQMHCNRNLEGMTVGLPFLFLS
jgi:hypothetical protein